MDLGVRQIRTAGKGSGSVELTLPGELRHLVGLPCRITLHDGVRPDIVLQPDLTSAFNALSAVWHSLALTLSGAAGARETGRFPAAAFTFGLQPRAGDTNTPYLSWQDGIAIAAGQRDPGATARSIAACAMQYAGEIDIATVRAAPFGAVCGYLACGVLACPQWQEPCDIAASELAASGVWQPGAAWRALPDARVERFWPVLAPALAATARLFAGWNRPDAEYAALCAAWRRGRSIELNRG
jgi:hypothetical protein